MLACGALLSCARRDKVWIEAGWPNEDTTVAVVSGADGRPLAPNPSLFAPGEPVALEVDRGERVRFFVAAYPPSATSGGRSIIDCGVAFGGSGQPLLAPDVSLASDVVVVDSGVRIDLSPSPLPFDIRFAACAANPCAGVKTSSIALLSGYNFTHVVLLSDRVAYVAGQIPTAAGQVGAIMKLEGGSLTALRTDPQFGGIDGFAWDHQRALLFLMAGGALDGHLSGIDLDGQTVTTPTSAHFVGIRGIASGPDGTLIAYGDKELVGFAAGSTSTTAYPIPGLKVDALRVAVASKDRVFVTHGSEIYRLDHGQWVQEYDPLPAEQILAIAADPELAVAVGIVESVFLRDEKTATWSMLPESMHPFGGIDALQSVASLGGGRFVVVGASGQAAMYIRGTWCGLGGAKTLFQQVATSSSGRTAIAVGVPLPGRATAQILQINVPPP
jgi:hypothetical protein